MSKPPGLLSEVLLLRLYLLVSLKNKYFTLPRFNLRYAYTHHPPKTEADQKLPPPASALDTP